MVGNKWGSAFFVTKHKRTTKNQIHNRITISNRREGFMETKPKVKVEAVIIESHTKNFEIGRRFNRFIMEEIEKLRGGKDGEKKENQN